MREPARAWAEFIFDSPWGILTFTLLLFLLHCDAIDLRPSEDQARGIWMEAAFLYQTQFDYGYLSRHAQYYSGPAGERSYLVSVLPTFLALLRMVTGSASATIIAYKLFTLTCGGLAAYLIYQIIRRYLGIVESALATAVAFTIPTVACQLDMLGMELPVMVPLILGMRAIMDQRYSLAAVWYALAGFIKLVSIVFVVGAIGWIILLALLGAARGMTAVRWRGLLVGVVLLGAVFVLQVQLFRLSGQSDPADDPRPTGPRLVRPDSDPNRLHSSVFWNGAVPRWRHGKGVEKPC